MSIDYAVCNEVKSLEHAQWNIFNTRKKILCLQWSFRPPEAEGTGHRCCSVWFWPDHPHKLSSNTEGSWGLFHDLWPSVLSIDFQHDSSLWLTDWNQLTQLFSCLSPSLHLSFSMCSILSVFIVISLVISLHGVNCLSKQKLGQFCIFIFFWLSHMGLEWTPGVWYLHVSTSTFPVELNPKQMNIWSQLNISSSPVFIRLYQVSAWTMRQGQKMLRTNTSSCNSCHRWGNVF